MPTLNSLRLDPRSYPLVLPHVSRACGQVYFGRKPIASLTDAESEFLDLCDGARTLAEVVSHTGVHPASVARLAAWFLWWDQEVPQDPTQHGAVERLVLAAGPEDAWLGMGGRLLLEASQRSTLVVHCFGTLAGAHQREAFGTADDASIICRDEAALAARLAYARQAVWGVPEQCARGGVVAGHDADAESFTALLRELILDALGKYCPTQVFVPAATCHNPGSALLLDTLLSLFVEDRIGAELHIYEDSPAANGHRPVDEFLSRFESSYVSPVEYFADFTESAHRKFSLLEVFRSRLDRAVRDAWERSAKRNSFLAGLPGVCSVERFWQVSMSGLN